MQIYSAISFGMAILAIIRVVIGTEMNIWVKLLQTKMEGGSGNDRDPKSYGFAFQDDIIPP